MISSSRVADAEISGMFRWQDFVAIVAAYLFVVFALCPGTRFIGFPVHHDDFNNLAHISFRWYPSRPVSSFALVMLSRLGIPVYYAGLHVLIVVYAFLSIGVLRRLLQVRSVPVLLLLPVGAAMLSYEPTVEFSKYTGLLTNLLSGVFAMIAMTLMVSGSGELADRPSRPLSVKLMVAVWVFSALSFWSKEDFRHLHYPAKFLGLCQTPTSDTLPSGTRNTAV